MRVRWYSERDNPLGPPPSSGFDQVVVAGELVPVQRARDQRMWLSVEWAAAHGIQVPPNWRESD